MNKSNPFFHNLRQQYCSSLGSTMVTLVIVGALLFLGLNLVNWGIIGAVTAPDLELCRQADGACWGFVAEKWRLILFGRFPYEEHWRAGLGTFVVIFMLVVSAIPYFWTRQGVKGILVGWVVSLVFFFAMMSGGFWGLTPIDSDAWGGLPLTIILTIIGMTASAPLGILLALGRRSKMPILRILCTGYIEFVRGVPLITVLFVATYIFPLLLPSSWNFDAFWRIALGISLFQAAYMAETVRGGLQTIPQAQFNAAVSLGLKTWQVYVYVILPQALVAIIPAFVNSLLSTFMDTSLVTVVSMYDLTGALRLALGDPQWRQFFIEGYIFIAVIYFVGSFVMSRYSFWLEERLKKAKTYA